MDSLLPTDIQAVIEQTQKIEDELFKQDDGAKSADAPSKEPEDVSPKTDEPPSQPEPDAQPASEPPPEPTPPPVEDFKHKYEVLQGKYNKEIRESKDKIKEVSDKLLYLEQDREKLLKQVMELTERVNRVDRVATDKVDEPAQHTELDSLPEAQYLKSEFPDVWKAMKTVVSHAVSSAVKDTKSKLEQVEKKVETSTKTAEAASWTAFNQYLDTNVEGWREINVDPEFKEWLNVPEPYSGFTKLELINRDIANHDGAAVAKYFKNFITEKNKAPASDTPTPTRSVPPAQIALPKARPNSPPPKRQDVKDIITTEYITDFYQKLQRGYYIGREAEAAAEEKRIEKAVAEGRVE